MVCFGFFCLLFTYFARVFVSSRSVPASAPAEVSAVTVCSRWDVIPVFSDTLTGIRGGEGDEKVCEGQPKSKSYRRRCRVGGFFSHMKPGF